MYRCFNKKPVIVCADTLILLIVHLNVTPVQKFSQVGLLGSLPFLMSNISELLSILLSYSILRVKETIKIHQVILLLVILNNKQIFTFSVYTRISSWQKLWNLSTKKRKKIIDIIDIFCLYTLYINRPTKYVALWFKLKIYKI